MFGRFLPKSPVFFDYFEQITEILVQTCKEFQTMTQNVAKLPEYAKTIKDLERKADGVTKRCTELLHQTFITPIERSDIFALTKRLDDVIDTVEAATSRMALYEINEMRPEACELAQILVDASNAIYQAIRCLRKMSAHTDEIKQQCVIIYQLENKADAVLRDALSLLFKSEINPILVIKWKELYERLEKAADRCESVANIIQGIIVEAS